MTRTRFCGIILRHIVSHGTSERKDGKMEAGIKFEQEMTVGEKDTAKAYTSGTLEVFATLR